MKIFLLIILISSSSAYAQIAKPNVCAEDVRKLCSGKIEQAEVASCVRINKDKLTGECKKLIFGAEDNARAFYNNCTGDVKKLCTKAMTGQAALFECLLSNRKSLSLKCKKSVDKVVNP
jgi:hypothetical protein